MLFSSKSYTPKTKKHAVIVKNKENMSVVIRKIVFYQLSFPPYPCKTLHDDILKIVCFARRVEWMSPEETYMHLESTGSKIYRGLVETLGSKKSTGIYLSISLFIIFIYLSTIVYVSIYLYFYLSTGSGLVETLGSKKSTGIYLYPFS